MSDEIPGSADILEYFLTYHHFHTLLDIGCGEGKLFPLLRYQQVTAIDMLPRAQVPLDGYPNVKYVRANFMTWQNRELFDAVLASHVVEHVADTDAFLRKFFRFLKAGGPWCLIWPPPKDQIVNHHVHVFNFGLMLYNIVKLGIDCSGVALVRNRYSLGIVGRKRKFAVRTDRLGELTSRFPFPVHHNFDGKNVPGVLNL